MRTPRLVSGTNVYHVMTRGNEKKKIFLDDADRQRFLDTLEVKGKNNEFILYAYCLMPNHIHLIVKEERQDISTFMKRINTSYAIYFNNKYDRVGHVFQGRFKSEPIETYDYLVAAIRYVHNNPVKANLTTNGAKYLWSSYRAYINGESEMVTLDTNFLLEMIDPDRDRAVAMFKELSALEGENTFIDVYDESEKEMEKLRVKKEIRAYTKVFLQKNNITYEELMYNQKNIWIRNRFIVYLKENFDLSIREFANLLKVDRNIIQRAKK